MFLFSGDRTKKKSLFDNYFLYFAACLYCIYDMNDVVIFPGMKLPIRFIDPVWIQYIGYQIDQIRQLHNTNTNALHIDRDMLNIVISYLLPRLNKSIWFNF